MKKIVKEYKLRDKLTTYKKILTIIMSENKPVFINIL